MKPALRRVEVIYQHVCPPYSPQVLRDASVSINSCASQTDPAQCPVRNRRVFEFNDYGTCSAILWRSKGISSKRPFFYESPDSAPHDRQVLSRLLSPLILFLDPPEHTQVRQRFKDYLTIQRVRSLESMISSVIDQHLDQLSQLPPGTTVDLVSTFSYPIPVTVLSKVLGFPIKDQEQIKRWSDMMVHLLGTPATTLKQGESMLAEFKKYVEYTRELVREKKRALERGEGDDSMITFVLKQQKDKDDCWEMSEDILVGNLCGFLFAGHETTTTLISLGIYALLSNPSQLQTLRKQERDAKDTRQVYAQLVDETLRWNAPSKRVSRTVVEDVQIPVEGSSPLNLKKGDAVFLHLWQANRDPKHFENPDKFDIERKNSGDHVGFGGGIHICIGQRVARLEGALALQKFFQRFPNAKLAPGFMPEYIDNRTFNGIHSLRVILQ